MSLPVPEDIATTLLKRNECVRALVNQPHTKPELVETLDMPRSTLDDVIRELEQVDLVEYRDGQWYPTFLGQMVFHVHRDYLGQLGRLTDALPVLDSLDTDTEVNWPFIEGADTHETHSRVQDAVMTTLLDHAEAATTVRVVTPNIVAGYGDRFYRNGTSGREASLEVIIPPEVHEWFYSTYPSVATDVLDDPNANVFHASIPFSFGLSIFDSDRAGITVFTDQGIAGLIVNDTNDALMWAEEQYDRVKQNAEPISPRGESS
ncbi:hypothetical protein V5735_04080 (plasmid) [Haladaptatus sp. SPP-AMP-3]|uniref:helix-turn-helix transcriptional regulator n=1 Tax=Haladaptatus sp. SPP-AMP-3 TaxID=3121295 RepID=UPI003C2CC422